VQKKIQAEPGPDAKPRWVGSGWTIANNKGKPVRKYEPFFSPTHAFEFANITGVSSTLLYDPVERAIATLHPDHIYEKVVFDPWRQESWDANDTVLQPDPAKDRDVGGFFRRLPQDDYLPTWYEQRRHGALGPQAQAAAAKAALHARTPKVAYFDTLGRNFLTIEHNRFKRGDEIVDEDYATRLELDIEGHQRSVTDALGRKVMVYAYDMLGHQIHTSSMEAGARWILHDVTGKKDEAGKDQPGKPVRAWDSRDHEFRTAYDPLRRPTDSFLREGAGAEALVGRVVYGESQPDPEANNLRGKTFQLFDQAGAVTSDQYDFKGNLLRSQRQLAQAYKSTLDWSAAVPLDADTYSHATRYDALNRPTELTSPDNSVIRHTYNEASLLDRVDTNLRGKQNNGQPVWTPFVTRIDYDAKGQRESIAYGNGARTAYTYDPLTFRLVHLLTRREAPVFPGDCPQPPPDGWPGCQAQNLNYTYDPVGNITHIRDDAQQTIYFRNQRVEPSADYTYDAVYRLIAATGREHLGQAGARPAPTSYNDYPRVGLLQPGDGNAMARYLERYVYDAVGNFQEMIHRGSGPANPGWTRAYAYDEASQLQHGRHSNRLTSTTIGATTATYSSGGDGYDAHGNMRRMPQLHVMQWDFKDHLQMTQRQAVNADDEDGVRHQGERTWYVYDASGQRVRKVTELPNGAVKDERAYLGGFEIYHRHGVDPLARETLHIMDDKRRIALVETRTEGDEPGMPAQLIRYQFANHLESSSLELDETGAVISYEEYYSYGSTSYQAARSQTETPKRHRYTGKERDEESGLYYHGARYYAPWLGRWASCDPKGLVDGLCIYEYCRSNPIIFIDTSGLGSDPAKYTVQKGDTYWDLARKSRGAYSVADLKAWNPGVNWTKLAIGSKINVSAPGKQFNVSAPAKQTSKEKYVYKFSSGANKTEALSVAPTYGVTPTPDFTTSDVQATLEYYKQGETLKAKLTLTFNIKFDAASDSVKNVRMIFGDVFSGSGQAKNNPAAESKKDVGPVPKGDYYIVSPSHPTGLLQRAKELGKNELREYTGSTSNYYWFALYAKDGKIDDSMLIDGVQRGGFRIHPGSISDGCVTFSNLNDFWNFYSIVIQAEKISYDGPDSAYGTLHVK
jgi:RHS repeat-associated protein